MSWLALLALPAILAIHWFRRDLPRRPATALWLWGDPQREPSSGRRRDRLVDRSSLRWELLAMAALALAVIDPPWFEAPPSRHVAVVLDSRRSLEALRSDGTTVTARLRRDLDRHLAGLSAQDRVSVVASGQPPRVIAGPAVDAATARTALATWRPDHAWHDLTPAVTLARELAGTDGALVVASDRPPEPCSGATIAGLVLRGEARSTAGLVSARWRDDGLHLVVRAWGGDGLVRILRVLGGGRSLVERRLVIDRQVQAVDLPLPAGTPPVITVQLDGDDPQPADDRVELCAPTPRMVRWYAPGEGVLSRALAAVGGMQAAPAQADLVCGPGPGARGAWRITATPGTAAATIGPFLPRRGHPWLDGIDPAGCRWIGGMPLTAIDPDDVLLATPDTCLLSVQDGPDRARILTIHADLAAHGLRDHPLLPVLVAQVMADRSAHLPGLDHGTIDAGTIVPVTLPPDAGALVVDDGKPLPAGADGRVLLPAPVVPGLHRLGLRRGAITEPWLTVAVTDLDPRLGDLSSCVERDAWPSPADGATASGRHPLLRMLSLAVALLAVVAAWRAQRREDGP